MELTINDWIKLARKIDRINLELRANASPQAIKAAGAEMKQRYKEIKQVLDRVGKGEYDLGCAFVYVGENARWGYYNGIEATGINKAAIKREIKKKLKAMKE